MNLTQSGWEDNFMNYDIFRPVPFLPSPFGFCRLICFLGKWKAWILWPFLWARTVLKTSNSPIVIAAVDKYLARFVGTHEMIIAIEHVFWCIMYGYPRCKWETQSQHQSLQGSATSLRLLMFLNNDRHSTIRTFHHPTIQLFHHHQPPTTNTPPPHCTTTTTPPSHHHHSCHYRSASHHHHPPSTLHPPSPLPPLPPPSSPRFAAAGSLTTQITLSTQVRLSCSITPPSPVFYQTIS